MNKRLPKPSAGFTLVELMIAVAIIGLLIAMAMPIYAQYSNRVKVSQAATFITTTSLALEAYHVQFGTYPATLAEVGIRAPALDPWGQPYRYLPIDINPPPNTGMVRRDRNMYPINTDFDLYSTGPDGLTQTQLTGRFALDDIVRAGNGSYVGKAQDF